VGGDSFKVEFANGALLWSISLAPDGKVDGVNFRPTPTALAPAPPSGLKPAPRT